MDSKKQEANTQMTPEMAKWKCKNFLATLLKLGDLQPPHVNICVKNHIQGLIDDKIDPETFTIHVTRVLKSTLQPCLIPFLRRTMPLLREALKNGEFSKEFYHKGIVPPSNPVTSKTPEAPSNPNASENEGMVKHKFKNFFEWLMKEATEMKLDHSRGTFQSKSNRK